MVTNGQRHKTKIDCPKNGLDINEKKDNLINQSKKKNELSLHKRNQNRSKFMLM